jgi:hypothetical protein
LAASRAENQSRIAAAKLQIQESENSDRRLKHN